MVNGFDNLLEYMEKSSLAIELYLSLNQGSLKGSYPDEYNESDKVKMYTIKFLYKEHLWNFP